MLNFNILAFYLYIKIIKLSGGILVKKKSLMIVSMVLVLSLMLTACFSKKGSESKKGTEPNIGGNATKAQPKILRTNNQSEPGSLHPGKAQGTHDSWVLEHVFEGLTRKTPAGGIEAGVAKEWKISEDGLTYTFTLRDDAKWSNGDPVTAQDFEFAWKYALNPATASEYAYQLYYLAGAEAYNTTKETDAAKLKALEDAVGVKALNDKTLEVKLAQPTPYFLELVSFYTYYPVNKKVQEANKDWANEASTYVSNGAFKLAEWKHKESIKLAKNENYFDKDKIKLDGIEFVMLEDENTAWQMYRTGDLDLLYPIPADVTAQLNASKDPELVIGDDLSVYFYRFNNTKKPFNNVKVRKALSMAIDRKVIVESVAQGGERPAYGIVPPGIPDVQGDYQKNTGNLFEENVEKAKQLLAEGLKEEKMDKLSFTLLYNTHDKHKKIAEAIQEMWRKNLGVEVTLENVEFQVKIDREDKLDYDVARAGWIGDYVDPMTFLDMFESKSQQNDTGWANADFDKLINQAKTTMDNSVRMKAMHDAEKIFIEEMPVMPIYFYTKPFTQKPYVKGVYTPVNRYPQFHYADIQK
ncbi:MAG: oligopeptide transport system substrate-binding protein [Petroclostridium sp.]|jgi:oligopeptide transport system substrate-binding protein|nr:peptide-binding protein [Clostridia bacterium]MDK2810702.1 oligopeptide transport system substrate-binding protein [Petroclostridium sp.]